ncbi:MAG TPA: hypothetical protein VND93_24405 [Myxococcales bacterium]|nr:hypothetical protein [Myxococcales bacterium]
MKRLAAIATMLLGLLAATLARADWREVTGLGGSLADIFISDGGVDGGHFSAHAPTAAHRVVDNGTGFASVSISTGSAKCTAISSGLLVVYQASASQTEGSPQNTFSGPVVLGCRATETLAGYGFGRNALTQDRLFTVDAGTFGASWAEIPPSVGGAAAPVAISARTVFGVDYGLIPRNGPGWFFVVGDHEADAGYFFPNHFPLRTEIYGTRDGGLRAISVGGNVSAIGDAGLLISYNGLAAVTYEPFDLGGSGGYVVHGVTLSELEGDQWGAGFGMLMVEGAGMPNVWSAIPDPAAVGKHWVPSTVQPPRAASTRLYDVVRCLDGRYCVAASSFSSADPKMMVYRNTSPPSVERPAFQLNEVSTATQLTLDAGDPDGDAVFVTWTPGPDAGLFFGSLGRASASYDGRMWDVGPLGGNSRLCGMDHLDVPVDVAVSDGLASHVQFVDGGYIRLIHTRPPRPADGALSVPAGSGQVSVNLAFPSSVCTLVPQRTAIAQPATPLQVSQAIVPVNQVQVSFTPPRTWCSAAAGSGLDVYEIRLTDGPLSSDAGTVTFDVLPWGVPDAPFGPRTAVQDAGTSATYLPDATHACTGSPGFPGVDTTWFWSAGGFSTPPQILGAGAAPLPSGGVSPSVTVVAPDCETGTVSFQAINTTRDGGMTGPDGGLTVQVVTTLSSLSTGTLLVTADAGPSLVTGDLALGIRCAAQHTGATADLQLYRDDGGFVSSLQLVPVPGPYQIPAPGACGGGLFEVRATATDPTGQVTAAPQPVMLPVAPAGLSSLTVPNFTITCGDAGTATVIANIASGQCQTETVDWSSSGAVAIQPATSTPGTPVELSTVSTDFGGLIGLPVTVTATATAETGIASMSQTVLVTADPFVSVVHRTDAPVSSESRVLGVEVTLTNTTACDVSGMEWHESLEGLTWLPDSVRGPDGWMSASESNGELVVPGISLAAGQSLTLRYAARPSLFGSPSPSGWVTLRGLPVSATDGLDGGTSTCGCQTAGGAAPAAVAVALALLVLPALRRARRRLRARS